MELQSKYGHEDRFNDVMLGGMCCNSVLVSASHRERLRCFKNLGLL